MNHSVKRIRTILFTEVCPLACNYCFLKTSPNFGTKNAYTKEKFLEEVEQADKDGVERLHFTGGEPFAYWSWIKEVIEKYQHRFEYGFNTSGYYCNFEVVQFLSNYKCYWTLSVDGPREVAMWRRPNNNNLKYDYWDTFEKNIPILLYFFPNITWKSIINKRLIKFMPKIYESAMRYGFRKIQFIKDFEEENWRLRKDKGCISDETKWNEKDYEEYNNSLIIISSLMIQALENQHFPTLLISQYNYLSNVLNKQNTEFSIKEIKCGIGGRDMSSMYNGGENKVLGNCIRKILMEKNMSLEEGFKEIFESFNNKCPNDKNCPFWRYCTTFGCIKDNYNSTGQWFGLTSEVCQKNKMELEQIIKVIAYANENLQDNEAYLSFLDYLIIGGPYK